MEGVLDLFWNYSVRMSSYIALEINKVPTSDVVIRPFRNPDHLMKFQYVGSYNVCTTGIL